TRIAPLESSRSLTMGSFAIGTETLTMGLTHTLSPVAVNDVRLNGSRQASNVSLGVNRAAGAQVPPDSLFFPAGFSWKDSDAGFSIPPFPPLSFGFQERDRTHQLQAVDNFSYVKNGHQLKFGADYRWFATVEILPRFLSEFLYPNANSPSQVYTGAVSTAFYVVDNIPRPVFVTNAFSGFAQDTWRARRGLTVTYGLRWEVNPVPRVSGGQAAISIVPNPPDTSSRSLIPSGEPLYATSWWNLAPRLGIAWQVHDAIASATVLRL